MAEIKSFCKIQKHKDTLNSISKLISKEKYKILKLSPLVNSPDPIIESLEGFTESNCSSFLKKSEDTGGITFGEIEINLDQGFQKKHSSLVHVKKLNAVLCIQRNWRKWIQQRIQLKVN